MTKALGGWARWCALALSALLLACGGGGASNSESGGGGGGGSNLAITVLTPRAEVTFVARNVAVVELSARIDNLGAGTTVFFGISGGDRVFARAEFVGDSPERVSARFFVRKDLPVGQYQETITFSLCRDAACTGSLLAPQVTATVVVNVLPNIEVASEIVLSRSGAQAAPTLRVPVSIPAAAGIVEVTAAIEGGVVRAQLVGNELVLTTQQVRSGTWQGRLSIVSSTNIAYFTETNVRYVVSPPPGGERALTLTPGALHLTAAQGQRVTRRIQAQPATWSSEPVVARIGSTFPSTPHLVAITRVNDTEFDVTVDLANYGGSSYLAEIAFQGGEFGGLAVLSLRIDVDAAFALDLVPGWQLSPATALADLRWRSPIRLTGGTTARWTASVDQPWITVRRSSGVTGQDEVELEVNPDPKAYPPLFTLPRPDAQLTISVDQPGVLPIRWSVPVENLLPTITSAAPGALIASSGRVVVRGNALGPELISRGGFAVTGATVRSTSFVADSRFVGDFNVMVLELEAATPGQDIELRIANPAFTSATRIPVLASAPARAGRADLPFDSYRPPGFSARHQAWFFAGSGTVWKLAASGAGWVPQQASLPGVIDADLAADELRLIAAAPQRLYVLDPATLALMATANQVGAEPATTIDTRMQALSKSIAWHLDGSGFMGLASDFQARIDLDPLAPTATYGLVGPGAVRRSPQPRNIVVSPDRNWVVFQHRGSSEPNVAYTVPPRALGRTPTLDLPYDADITAIANNGLRALDANGVVRALSGSASLRVAVPTTHVAAGFGLTPDGRFGLVYAVRRSGAGASEVALDPLLLVVDVSVLPSAGSLTPVVSLSLSAPVGCRLPRAAAEPCEHVASVSVDAATRMAVVLGPRGVEVVPLPDVVRSAATVRDQPRQRQGVHPIRRVP